MARSVEKQVRVGRLTFTPSGTGSEARANVEVLLTYKGDDPKGLLDFLVEAGRSDLHCTMSEIVGKKRTDSLPECRFRGSVVGRPALIPTVGEEPRSVQLALRMRSPEPKAVLGLATYVIELDRLALDHTNLHLEVVQEDLNFDGEGDQ